jgi:putative intracellular protease/amidase
VSKRILIITGDGGESYETWFAVHRFQEAGYVAHVAAPSKRRLHLVMHDFEPGWDTYKESPGYAIESDVTFDDVRVARDSPRVRRPAEVDLLHLPRDPARRGCRTRQRQAIHLLRARAS